MDATSSVISYLSGRQCATQWKIFLLSTAQELAEKFSAAELRTFMRRVGGRFGRELPVPACATLDDIQLAMSQIWTRLDWGWVQITDETDHLRLQHYCAPSKPRWDAKRWPGRPRSWKAYTSNGSNNWAPATGCAFPRFPISTASAA